LNFRLILHFAKVLALASVRAQRMKGSIPTGLAKSPRLNLIVGVAAFIGTSFLAGSFGGAILGELTVPTFLSQIAIFLPSLMTLAAVMYGMLFEFGQSSAAGSSDIINWLPLHAIEFVLASVLSMLYFLAPILGILYGATLGLSLNSNMLDVGLFSLAIGKLSLFLGAFILEIVRAITNRVSSTFYKRSGRTTVFVRMFLFIIVFVVFMLISNVNFLFFLLEQFAGGLESAWFVPILWPSLTITSYLAANIPYLIVYALLSITLTILLLLASVRLREKYWVPAPFAVKIASSKPYTPKKGFLGTLGFSGAEAALIKKDFRGLTRRKEMIVWIAVPFGISIISLFSTQSTLATATSTFEKLMLFFGPIIGVLMLAFYVSLTSIGQEGSAFLNLTVIPLNKKELIRAKLAPSTILSLCGMTIVTVLIQLIVQLRLDALIAVTATLFALLFECNFVGLAVGTRFPDFAEVPRARFVDQKGVWSGLVIIAASAGTTLVPLFFYNFSILGTFPILMAPVISAVVCVSVCYASYRSALNSIQKIVTRY